MSCFHVALPISARHQVECISTSAVSQESSSTTFQVVSSLSSNKHNQLLPLLNKNPLLPVLRHHSQSLYNLFATTAPPMSISATAVVVAPLQLSLMHLHLPSQCLCQPLVPTLTSTYQLSHGPGDKPPTSQCHSTSWPSHGPGNKPPVKQQDAYIPFPNDATLTHRAGGVILSHTSRHLR